ncbi:TRAP transporter small permease [Paenisporosarcina indica]|uniref:TRAP transporter small permease n=1 Tax=Paenisporosarcina indica TaxID=650093 RepID=UPI00094FC982|nr:TRAP transporter small permease [Paenisporosarcina indica]
MKAIIGLADRLNHWVFNTIAILFGLVTLLTIYQVFARFILHSPLVWSEEVVRYSMIWIVLLGTSVALRKGLLVSVEIVLHIVPRKIKKMMEVLIVLLNVIFLFILIRYGFILLELTNGQKIGALDLPVSVIYYAIPVAGILGILNALLVLVEILTKKEKEEDKIDGSALI